MHQDDPIHQDDERLQRIQRLEIQLPRFSRPALISRACKHSNALERQKAAQLTDLYAEIELLTPASSCRSLERACVNYLRHLLEARYPDLAQLRGNAAQFELYALAKGKMLSKIAEVYPWLDAEAARQGY